MLRLKLELNPLAIIPRHKDILGCVSEAYFEVTIAFCSVIPTVTIVGVDLQHLTFIFILLAPCFLADFMADQFDTILRQTTAAHLYSFAVHLRENS